VSAGGATLNAEVDFHKGRLSAHKCDECRQPFEGDGVPVSYHLDGNGGRLVFLVCPGCHTKPLESIDAMAAFFSRFYVSEPAAEVLEAMASGAGQRLSEEIATLQSWIDTHCAPGQRCDECGRALTLDDPATIVDIPVSKLGRKILFAICNRCRLNALKAPRCVAAAEKFLARMVGERAAMFIKPLLEATRPRMVN
jgi:hypothetical protein